MVRINLLPPNLLLDQHLLAEYNEILMLCGYVKKQYPFIDGRPEEYCLGKGHIKFFSNKMTYLIHRFNSIREELTDRGYSVEKIFPFSPVTDLDAASWQDYTPTIEAYSAIIERIIQKIDMKGADAEGKIIWYRYRSLPMCRIKYVNALNNFIFSVL